MKPDFQSVKATIGTVRAGRFPGGGITVDTGGAVKIDPNGLLNKFSHKAGKWLKKKL